MTDMTLTQWLARIEEAYRPGGTLLAVWQNVEADRLGKERPYHNERDGLLEYILNEFADLRYEDGIDGDVAMAQELWNRLESAVSDLMRVRGMLDAVMSGKAALPEDTYAAAMWTVDDVHECREKAELSKWTDDQARDWLIDNEHQIQDGMIARGWESIANLMPVDDDGDES